MNKFIVVALLGLAICNAAVQKTGHFVDTKTVLAEVISIKISFFVIYNNHKFNINIKKKLKINIKYAL